MPILSFQGASNFSITGGNFSKIGGHVLTCNVNHFPRQWQSNPLPDHEEIPMTVPRDREEGRQRVLARRETAKPQLALPFPESVATDVSASRNIASPAADAAAVVRSRVSSPSPLRIDSEDPEDGDNSEYLTCVSRCSMSPSEREEYQYTTPSDPAQSVSRAVAHRSNNLTPPTDSLDLHRLTPADQQEVPSPVCKTPRPRYPDISPNRSSTYPGQTTHLARAPPLVLPRSSSADLLRPQRVYTESPPTINHQAFDPSLHASATPAQFRLEDPVVHIVHPQAQHDTKGYTSTTSLLNTLPQSPLWTPGSISRWSHGVRPEDGLASESSPVFVPEPHPCHCSGMVRNYPPLPFPLVPASVPEHHQLLYNYPHTLPWGPLAPQQSYQSNGTCDGSGYGHSYGQVLYASGRPSCFVPQF